MRIACVGGGPAGLYFAILSKLRDASSEVRVLERGRRGAATGWGIVYWEDLLISLSLSDPVIAGRLRGISTRWGTQQVYVDGLGTGLLGGYGYSVCLVAAQETLTQRALELGVQIDFEATVDPADLPEADLVVAADGANSRVREHRREVFGTRSHVGGNHYMWLGCGFPLERFTFAFARTDAGWVWFHGYAFDDDTSTVVVECPPETWAGLGFDRLDHASTLAALSEVFRSRLDGRPLNAGREGQTPPRWLRFNHVTNSRWSHDNLVLLGDAAHTTHYSIGSGTRLALEDAIELDVALRRTASIPDALAAFHAARRDQVADRQQAAELSRHWFENAPALLDAARCPIAFAYELRTRRDPADGRSQLGWTLHRATQHPLGLRARQAVSDARVAIKRYRSAGARP
jgi:anthraniloyl-CoA monooxygenase